MKNLFLIRGLPGSGKSTLAETLAPATNVAADHFFELEGQYLFDPTKLKDAHEYCRQITSDFMHDNQPVVAVHNTFCAERELRPYYDLAKKFNYKVSTLIVENRHGSLSVHDVPEDTITRMRSRFNIAI